MVKIHANSESEEAARKEVEMIEQLPRNPHPLLPRPLAMTTESMAASAALLARLTNVSRPPFPFPPPFLTKSPGPFPFPTSAGFPPSLHPHVFTRSQDREGGGPVPCAPARTSYYSRGSVATRLSRSEHLSVYICAAQ